MYEDENNWKVYGIDSIFTGIHRKCVFDIKYSYICTMVQCDVECMQCII